MQIYKPLTVQAIFEGKEWIHPYQCYFVSQTGTSMFFPFCQDKLVIFWFHTACLSQTAVWRCTNRNLRPTITRTTWLRGPGWSRTRFSLVAESWQSTRTWGSGFSAKGWRHTRFVFQYWVWNKLRYWCQCALNRCLYGLAISRSSTGKWSLCHWGQRQHRVGPLT